MDQLAEIAGNLPVSELPLPNLSGGLGQASLDNGHAHESSQDLHALHRPNLRRPMLSGLRTIDSIRDLVPFFSHVSISSYESVYAGAGNGGGVNWELVEHGLLDDMFDGRG